MAARAAQGTPPTPAANASDLGLGGTAATTERGKVAARLLFGLFAAARPEFSCVGLDDLPLLVACDTDVWSAYLGFLAEYISPQTKDHLAVATALAYARSAARQVAARFLKAASLADKASMKDKFGWVSAGKGGWFGALLVRARLLPSRAPPSFTLTRPTCTPPSSLP